MAPTATPVPPQASPKAPTRPARGAVGGPGRRARQDGAHGHGRPPVDQYEGPHELGQAGAHHVRVVYLAAVQAAAAGLLFLLVECPPGAAAYGLFEAGLFFRAVF